MRNFRINTLTKSGLFMLLVLLALVLTQCTTPAGNTSAAGDKNIDLDSVILLSVGDTQMTLKDLLMHPQTYQIVNEGWVQDLSVTQECLKRGIMVTPEEIQEKLLDLYEQVGGSFEEFRAQQFPPYMPDEVIMNTMTDWAKSQLYNEKLRDALYSEQKGSPTEEEIQNVFDTIPWIKTQVAQEQSIEESTVTLDMARDNIIDYLKGTWFSENGQPMIEDLKKQAGYEVFINDILGLEPPAEVPEAAPPITFVPPESEVQVPVVEPGQETEEAVEETGDTADESTSETGEATGE